MSDDLMSRTEDLKPGIPPMLEANPPPQSRPVVLFDGHCSFCNRTVRWVIRRDRTAHFRFAPLHSAAAHRILAQADPELNPGALPDAMILVDGKGIHFASTAALRIARRLRFPWPFAAAALLVPRPLRDAAYRAFARNRYRWFPRVDSCPLPPPEIRERFVGLGSPNS